MTTEPRILLWIPLPPPYAGPEVASQLLAEACKAHLPSVRVENASLRTVNMHKGRLDIGGVAAFAKAYCRYVARLKHADVVYLVAAANTTGCIRDATLIATAKVLRRSIVLHLRGGRYHDYYATSSPFMKRLLEFAWGSARKAIVQAPRLANSLQAAAPHVDVAVLPNGLPSQQFRPKRDYTTASPRILFVGHLTYFKGFNDLIAAFRAIRRRWPTAQLVCAGELPRPERAFADFLPSHLQASYLDRRLELCDEVRSFVKSGSTCGVEYVGVVSGAKKAALFETADIFVLPSYTEGFSLAILEAMLCGLPVVTTNVGGSPDIVQPQNGLLLNPGDVDALIGALDELLADPQRREVIGRTNAREARERYDICVVAAHLASILRDCAGR